MRPNKSVTTRCNAMLVERLCPILLPMAHQNNVWRGLSADLIRVTSVIAIHLGPSSCKKLKNFRTLYFGAFPFNSLSLRHTHQRTDATRSHPIILVPEWRNW